MEITVPIEAVLAKASAAKTLSKSRKGKDFLAELTAAQAGPGGGVSQNQYEQSLSHEAEHPSPELKEGETAALAAVPQGEKPGKEASSLPPLFTDGGGLKTGKGNVIRTKDEFGVEMKSSAYKEMESDSGMKLESSSGMEMDSGSEEKRFLPAEAFAAAEMVGLEEPLPGKVPREGLPSFEPSKQSPLSPKRASPSEMETSLWAERDEGIKVPAAKEDFFLCPSETGEETEAAGESALKRGKTGHSLTEREGGGLTEEHDYALLSSGFKASLLSSAGEAKYVNNKETVFKPLLTAMRPQKNGVPGDGEIRVSLKPDFLGQVSIRLSRQGGLMKGMIIVESALVREVIESHLPEFKQRLAEQNLHMEELTVFLEDPGEGQSGSGYSSLWRDCLYHYPGPRNLQTANMALMEWENPQGGLNILA